MASTAPEPLLSMGESGVDVAGSGAGGASDLPTSPSTCAEVEAIDWHRLVSEQQTIAAALQGARKRLESLEQESQELQGERSEADAYSFEALSRLRNRPRRAMGLQSGRPRRHALQRLAAPTLTAATAVSKYMSPACGTSTSASSSAAPADATLPARVGGRPSHRSRAQLRRRLVLRRRYRTPEWPRAAPAWPVQAAPAPKALACSGAASAISGITIEPCVVEILFFVLGAILAGLLTPGTTL